MFNNFFPKNHTVYEIVLKYWVETEGPHMMSQHGADTLRAGLARLHALMCMHVPMHLCTHMHACMCRHAHTDQEVILLLLFHGNSDLCYIIRTFPPPFF
jgi:hypothetical protein